MATIVSQQTIEELREMVNVRRVLDVDEWKALHWGDESICDPHKLTTQKNTTPNRIYHVHPVSTQTEPNMFCERKLFTEQCDTSQQKAMNVNELASAETIL